MNQQFLNANSKDFIEPKRNSLKQHVELNCPAYKKPISFPTKPIDQQAKQKYMKHLQTIQKSIRKIMNNRQMSLESSIYTTKQLNKFKQSRRKRRSRQMSSSFLVKSIMLIQKPQQNFIKQKQNCNKQKQKLVLKRQFSGKKSLRVSGKFNQSIPIFQINKALQNNQKLCITSSSILSRKDMNVKLQSHQSLQYSINKKIQLKLKKYNQQQNLLLKLHQISPNKYSNDKKWKAFVGYGNNAGLVKQTLKQRWWWQVTQQKKEAEFIWSQLKDKQFFGNTQKKERFVHNHFYKNQYLGNKKTLFYLMRDFYKNIGRQVFDYLPITFHIVNLNDHQWPNFVKYYQQQQIKYKSTEIFKKDKLLWIVKPGQNSNRGNGIKVCQTINQIQQIINQVQKLGPQQKKKQSFIIQKYISKPFLYFKRKFDIRCYMLLVKIGKSIKGYWCKEGYIRTSGKYFDLNNYRDNFIHLTNDAIQTHSSNYGQHEQGNKISMGAFQKYLDANYPLQYNYMEQIYPKLKAMAEDSMKASIYSIGMQNSLPVFELFGLDFMIDESFKPWLIQINTNPCLQTSCPVLKSIIPKVLDDCFKLSLDILYPSPVQYFTHSNSNKPHLIPDTQHLFQLIFDSNQYCRKQEVNERN